MDILTIIPARAGSKGIKNKNLKKLNGIPLIEYTIRAAQESKCKNIIISSDSENIINIAKKYKLNFIRRPKSLAQDDSLIIDVVLDIIQKTENKFDYVMLLQPTSPLRNSTHILESIKKLKKFKRADSLVSVVKVPHNFNPDSIYNFDNQKLSSYSKSKKKYRRQDKKKYFARNGPAIVIAKTKNIKKSRSLYGGNLIPYEMSYIDSFDIDDLDDFNIVESIIKFRRTEK